MAITIDGKKYEVLKDLGYQHGAGCYAKRVATDQGSQIAVRDGGGRSWRFWTNFDRIEPLARAEVAKMKRKRKEVK